MVGAGAVAERMLGLAEGIPWCLQASPDETPVNPEEEYLNCPEQSTLQGAVSSVFM